MNTMGWTEADRAAVREAIRAMLKGESVDQVSDSTEYGQSSINFRNMTLQELRATLTEITIALDGHAKAVQLIGGR